MILPPVPDITWRRHSLRIAIGVWLLFISLLALVNSVGLSRLTEQARRDTQATQIKALTGQVAKLAQQAEAGKRQPTPASQAEVAAARQALETRLVSLEQVQADTAHASDLQALQDRVSAIEHREHAIKATPVPRHARPPVAARPRLPVPPFRIVGIELRGGERFLSVAAPDATSLTSIHLLREGDSNNGWQLQSIDAHAALFVVKGQTQRVALP